MSYFARISAIPLKQKDYQTALVNFKRALAFNLGNQYAVEAIGNVSRYIQQSCN